MTDKPAMTIEETAAQLAGWLTDPHFMKQHLVTALRETYARGRRDGLDEALPIIGELAGELDRVLGALLLFEERIKDPTPQHIEQFIKDGKSSSRKSLKNHQERLRALKEKEPTK